ncbi:MAG: GNAT family N-acetyltransferase [Clostridiales bacterium]|nr:GNAT family N-acetyltransferase [Clostridiales bacterium]
MIRQAGIQDAAAVAELALLLWPEHTLQELQEEFEGFLSDSACGVFLFIQEGRPAGFAQVQLRHDYVEGTSTSPVGYLEGIYVRPAYRKQGMARKLVSACEAWAREKGCREFASDCLLDNRDSLAFHLALGFMEAGRIICFTKDL